MNLIERLTKWVVEQLLKPSKENSGVGELISDEINKDFKPGSKRG